MLTENICKSFFHSGNSVSNQLKNSIEIHYDEKIDGYVISMPDFISLEILEEWQERFNIELSSKMDDAPFKLLLDSNKHDFESIQCLKILRDYLSELREVIDRVAFVAPANFVEPHIESESEA